MHTVAIWWCVYKCSSAYQRLIFYQIQCRWRMRYKYKRAHLLSIAFVLVDTWHKSIFDLFGPIFRLINVTLHFNQSMNWWLAHEYVNHQMCRTRSEVGIAGFIQNIPILVMILSIFFCGCFVIMKLCCQWNNSSSRKYLWPFIVNSMAFWSRYSDVTFS